MTEEALFELAANVDPAERAAILDRECAGDPTLRARIDALLAADAESTRAPFLEPPTRDASTDEAGLVLAGKYKLVEKIGEGGMGTVWLANQLEPVKRRVAVKLVKAGMDSRQVLARFDAERQALAMMDHPNIAKVLDAGLTPDNRPFFVMELVKGLPITEYCDAKKLTPRERLELFVPVTQAIQHAHQKGIIHRDIKPSNVLIALYDDRAVPKVIDFGVAKATGGTLTEQTINTGFGGVVGTPQYMSPEQATLNNLDIDTRSDVYSLGVLLYELLAGSPPFAQKELEKRGLLEILRVVREEEPPRPSNKLSTADALPTLSANRATEPKKLTGLLRNELDWIVMKALEKDRTRRYETANGFAADVNRYLAGEAVLAHPPSAAYRLKKAYRRNKGAVIAAGLVLAALVAGVVGTALGLIEARKQESLAKREANEKESARQVEAEQRALAQANETKALEAFAEAQRANRQAELRLVQTQRGNALLISIFKDFDHEFRDETIRNGDPLEAVLAKRLIEAGKNLEADSVGDSLAVARMQRDLGVTLLGLGFPYDSAPLLEKACRTLSDRLPTDDESTVNASSVLALVYLRIGKQEAAVPLLEHVLNVRRKRHGPTADVTLLSMSNLAHGLKRMGRTNDAIALYEEVMSHFPSRPNLPVDIEVKTLGNLAACLQTNGTPAKAVPLLEKAYELARHHLGDRHAATADYMSQLGDAYRAVNRPDRARPLLEKSLKDTKELRGQNHPQTLRAMNNLATLHAATGRPDLAVPLYEDAARGLKATLGEDDDQTLETLMLLAGCYMQTRKASTGLTLFERVVQARKGKLGPEHPLTLNAMYTAALGQARAERYDLAVPSLEQLLPLMAKVFGPDNHLTFETMRELGVAYFVTGRLDKSIPHFERLLALETAKLGRRHEKTLVTITNLGINHRDAGNIAEGIRYLREAYEASKGNAEGLWPGQELLRAYGATDERAKAAGHVTELLKTIRIALPKPSLGLASELLQVGTYHLTVGDAAVAEPLVREALEIREALVPEVWSTFNAQSLLGEVLLRQGKPAEASPMLHAGYEGMKQRQKSIPPGAGTRIQEALNRLIMLCQITDQPVDAAKWQAERAKYPAEVAPPPKPAK